ncbi:hypothetical protein ACA910_022251 [Epithemia clementina (nom. ined.)]
MNNLASSSSAVTETVTVTLRNPPKGPPPPTTANANRRSVTLTPCSRPKLKVLTSNQLPVVDHGGKEVVRKLSRNSSSPGNWLQGNGDFASSPNKSLFSNDSAPVLPNRAPDAATSVAPTIASSNLRRTRSSVYRAAEGGRQDVLPVTSALPPKSPLRARTRSTSSFSSRPYASFSGAISADQLLRSPSKSLRSRRRSSARIDRTATNDAASCMSDDHSVEFSLFEHEEEPSSPKVPVYADDNVTGDGEESIGANKKLSKPPSKEFLPMLSYYDNNMLLNMKPPQFFTLILLLLITCFVAGSYRQVLAATGQIEQVRLGESTLLVHLHKIEQQALQLAENLKHISERNDGVLPPSEADQNSAEVDNDLLRVQVEKLRDMEAELDHEVRSLRKTIQQSARQEMTKSYGQGAIQVFLEIEPLVHNRPSGGPDDEGSFYDRRNALSIRLWYDTPHTVWTFLQQIQNGAWNGALFSIQHGRALVAEPDYNNNNNKGGSRRALQPSLDFVEPSERGHERYTVTLTDTSFAINLQDNKKLYKQEACVGIIFEGFDVLHNIVKDSAKSQNSIRIKTARASHMTRAESAGLI